MKGHYTVIGPKGEYYYYRNLQCAMNRFFKLYDIDDWSIEKINKCVVNEWLTLELE